MAIRYTDLPRPTAIFEGVCAPEEADALLEWLRLTPAPVADLSGCTEPHMALIQLLIAASAGLTAPPADPIFRACLDAHLARAAAPAASGGPGKARGRARRATKNAPGRNGPDHIIEVPT